MDPVHARHPHRLLIPLPRTRDVPRGAAAAAPLFSRPPPAEAALEHDPTGRARMLPALQQCDPSPPPHPAPLRPRGRRGRARRCRLRSPSAPSQASGASARRLRDMKELGGGQGEVGVGPPRSGEVGWCPGVLIGKFAHILKAPPASWPCSGYPRVFRTAETKNVDARNRSGHDDTGGRAGPGVPFQKFASNRTVACLVRSHRFTSSWPDSFRPSTGCFCSRNKDVDARNKSGHDGGRSAWPRAVRPQT